MVIGMRFGDLSWEFSLGLCIREFLVVIRLISYGSWLWLIDSLWLLFSWYLVMDCCLILSLLDIGFIWMSLGL